MTINSAVSIDGRVIELSDVKSFLLFLNNLSAMVGSQVAFNEGMSHTHHDYLVRCVGSHSTARQTTKRTRI